MSNKGTYSVYKLTSPNGKVYIGCTGQNPKDRWNHGCKYHHNEELVSDIKKFGWDSFEHIVLHSGLEENDAYGLEKELIHTYNSNDPNYGYNKSIGGKFNSGLIRSEEYRQKLSERMTGEKNHFYGKYLSETHRQKISEANMGHSVSEETRRKIGNGNRGKTRSEETINKWRESRKNYIPSEETKKKIGDSHRGKILSEETKRKIGDANRGRRASEETRKKLSDSSTHKREVLCVETGIIYNSIRDAAKDVATPASNIYSVCVGKTKTAGGYSWKYVKESED